MKKLVLLPIFALCIASIMTSCGSKSGQKLMFEVTVIAKDSSFFNTVSGLPKVIVVTKGGDTLEAYISEDIALNNRMPFKATMKKTSLERFGRVLSAQ